MKSLPALRPIVQKRSRFGLIHGILPAVSSPDITGAEGHGVAFAWAGTDAALAAAAGWPSSGGLTQRRRADPAAAG
jgi:hypothetical protein